MIDSHYSKLAYQPIDFIELNDLKYLSGNLVKYVSRYYTIERADINVKAQKERILFYLERSKYNIDNLYCDVIDLPIYILRNNFKEWQGDLLIKYFIALNQQNTDIIDDLIVDVKLL